MAESEAAGLLRTGALYARRVGLRSPGGGMIFAGIKRGAFSLYFDDAPIYHFDLEGRWQRAFIHGIHYRKGLDNAVDALDRVREGDSMVIKRRSLSYLEIAELDETIRNVAIDLRPGEFHEEVPPAGIEPLRADDLASILDRIASWDAAAWFSHREKYVAAYGRSAILLPPDAQNAIVLQATDGSFFRTPPEFADHAKAVSDLLGRRAIAASSIFLAGDTLLNRPIDDLFSYVETIGSSFAFDATSAPKRPKDRPFDRPELSGIDIYHDPAVLVAESEPLGPGDWKRLAEGRVRRLTIKAREGADSLSGRIQDVRAAGIAVAVLLPHGNRIDETLVRQVAGWPLGAKDIVYLIDEEESTEANLASVRAALKEGLSPLRQLGAKVAVYNPEKQWN